jgi:hypothetical protein
MKSKKKNKKQNKKYLNAGNVIRIAKSLIYISNKFPLGYLAEKDFYPLIIMGLRMLGYKFEYEVGAGGGRIDFKTKGTNPTYLEVALARRTLVDANFENLKFIGCPESSPELHPSQNRKEIGKLKKIKLAKGRFLLLIDLQKSTEKKRLRIKNNYIKKWPTLEESSEHAINVIYVGRGKKAKMRFTILGKKRGRKKGNKK